MLAQSGPLKFIVALHIATLHDCETFGHEIVVAYDKEHLWLALYIVANSLILKVEDIERKEGDNW